MSEYTTQGGGKGDSRRTLETAGYTFKGEGTCRSCHAALWWFRTPRGKNTPYDAPDLTKREDITPENRWIRSHWATCPHSSGHHRHPLAPEAPPRILPPAQPSLFNKETA